MLLNFVKYFDFYQPVLWWQVTCLTSKPGCDAMTLAPYTRCLCLSNNHDRLPYQNECYLTVAKLFILCSCHYSYFISKNILENQIIALSLYP